MLNLDPNGAPNSTFLSDGSGNAFWNSGAGPAADANGNIYALSANGPFDTTLLNEFPSNGDYGDTFLKLSTQGSLAVSDYFTPFDQASDAQNDGDLGSGGAIVLPDMIDGSGKVRHLAAGAGKDGNIYVVDRDNMGKFVPGATSNSYIYQELGGALPGGEFATAAYFNDSIYYGPEGGALRRFTITQARVNAFPAAMTSTVFAYPGVTPSVSSSGNSSGIVWAYENSRSGSGSAVLHAYDAIHLSELYNSNQVPQRDQFGEANKFIAPTICNGKVFVGTTNSVGVFGLLTARISRLPRALRHLPRTLRQADGLPRTSTVTARLTSFGKTQLRDSTVSGSSRTASTPTVSIFRLSPLSGTSRVRQTSLVPVRPTWFGRIRPPASVVSGSCKTAYSPTLSRFPLSQFSGISQLLQTSSAPARPTWFGRIQLPDSAVSGLCKMVYPPTQSGFRPSQSNGISQLQQTSLAPARPTLFGRIQPPASVVSGSCKRAYPPTLSHCRPSQFSGISLSVSSGSGREGLAK